MSRGSLGVLSAKVALDTVDFNRNITAMKRELKVAKSETELASRGIVGYGKSSKASAAEIDGLTKQINIQKQALEAHDAIYKQAVETHGTNSREAQNAANNYNKTTLEIDKLTKAQESLIQKQELANKQIAYDNSSYKKWSDNLSTVGDKADKLGDGMISAGKKWSVASTVIGGATALTAKAAIDYQQSFSDVTKTVDGTAQELDVLSDSIRQMSTEIPTSAVDLAQLAATAGQLGIETPKIEGFTRTIADLGVATNLAGEEGASMLAKFANITKMSQDDFDRLGSSIVDLGNHFSTTENDIMQMAMRLAGAGTQIGMTQADILGLSTSLSSVGIEAEAGGSAFSKVMVNMQLAVEKGMGSFDELIDLGNQTGVSFETMVYAVQKGGKELKSVAGQMGLTSNQLRKMYNEADKSALSLVQFSEVAGMTNAEFANLFKENPAEAIMKFVQGLAAAESQGKSAIAVLDDMDIKEVRLRDSLLRAANASGIFQDAIDMSSKAWEENTALTAEAETKYATTASQIQIAKNKITDLSITFGNELLPVIADVLESSGPLVELLKDMLKGFADLSPETKKFIFTLGAIAIAGGPVLTLAGGLTKGFGSLATGTSKVVGWLGKAKYGLNAVEGATAATSSGVLGLTGNVAGASSAGSAFAGVFGSAGAASVGATLLATTGIVVGVGLALWGLHEAYESSQRSGSRWGTEVTKEQDKVLKKHQELLDEGTMNMELYQAGISESAEKVKDAYNGITDSMSENIQKQQNELKKSIEELPEYLQEAANKEAEQQEKIATEKLENAKKNVEEINKIMDNASQYKRKLSEEENEIIKRLTKELTEDQLTTLGISAEEQKKILKKMSTDMSDWSEKEHVSYRQKLDEQIVDLNVSLERSSEKLKEVYKDNPKELEKQMKILKDTTQETMDDLVVNVAKSFEEQGKSITELAFVWEQYGYKTEEVQDLVQKSLEASNSMTNLFAEGTKEADKTWNSMILDEKTGKVKDNLGEFLANVAKSEEDWQKLVLVAKEATISSNARAEIGIALGEAGKWNELSLQDKKVIVHNDEALLNLFNASNDLGMWNETEILLKTLGINNADAVYKIISSKENLEAWNNLSPELKQLLINNDDKEKIIQTETLYREFMKLPDEIKNINISADTSGATEAQEAINQVRDKNVMIRVTYEGKQTGHTAIMNAKGTNFHPGGDMIVNDQPGSLYREAVKFPGGNWFIPEGRNVYIKGAKRGTQVMPAGITRAKWQNYETGTGFTNDFTAKLIPFQKPKEFNQDKPVIKETKEVVVKGRGDTYQFYVTSNGTLSYRQELALAKRLAYLTEEIKDKDKRAKGDVRN